MNESLVAVNDQFNTWTAPTRNERNIDQKKEIRKHRLEGVYDTAVPITPKIKIHPYLRVSRETPAYLFPLSSVAAGLPLPTMYTRPPSVATEKQTYFLQEP
jgi:hypothetical protein